MLENYSIKQNWVKLRCGTLSSTIKFPHFLKQFPHFFLFKLETIVNMRMLNDKFFSTMY
jgi:hypothetical protein